MKNHFFIKFLSILIIFGTILFLYARYLNTTGLKVKETAIYHDKFPEEYNGFKITHFSDIHYGRTTTENDLKKLVKELNNLNADIVIFTGDLFDTKNINEKDAQMLTNYLKDINAKLGKFAIIGDYDKYYLNEYKNIIEKSEFILLDNTSKLIYQNSTIPLNFIGLSSINDISELYANEYFNITLIHEPDLVTNINNSPLIFAGHSLGGQIRIPFIGGLRKKAGAQTYIDSYYQINETKMYISNGIGTEDFSFRLFNKPTITLYRLYNS